MKGLTDINLINVLKFFAFTESTRTAAQRKRRLRLKQAQNELRRMPLDDRRSNPHSPVSPRSTDSTTSSMHSKRISFKDPSDLKDGGCSKVKLLDGNNEQKHRSRGGGAKKQASFDVVDMPPSYSEVMNTKGSSNHSQVDSDNDNITTEQPKRHTTVCIDQPGNITLRFSCDSEVDISESQANL